MVNHLKRLRVQQNVTQAELAQEVKVSRQTIISIESNRYAPSVVLAIKLAKTLNVHVEDIFQLEIED